MLKIKSKLKEAEQLNTLLGDTTTFHWSQICDVILFEIILNKQKEAGHGTL